jgi:hypothetical protein
MKLKRDVSRRGQLDGVWFVSVAVVSILGGAIGPFAHLIIGAALLVIGNSITGRTSAE